MIGEASGSLVRQVIRFDAMQPVMRVQGIHPQLFTPRIDGALELPAYLAYLASCLLA